MKAHWRRSRGSLEKVLDLGVLCFSVSGPEVHSRRSCGSLEKVLDLGCSVGCSCNPGTDNSGEAQWWTKKKNKKSHNPVQQPRGYMEKMALLVIAVPTSAPVVSYEQILEFIVEIPLKQIRIVPWNS